MKATRREAEEPASKRHRSFQKCQPCRKGKVKCTPSEREFEAGERCDHCVAKDWSCGPNQRFQRTMHLPDPAKEHPQPPPHPRRLAPSTSPPSPPHLSSVSFSARSQVLSNDAFGSEKPIQQNPHGMAGALADSLPRRSFSDAAEHLPKVIRTDAQNENEGLRYRTGFMSLRRELDLVQHLRSRLRALREIAPAIAFPAFIAHQKALKLEAAYVRACAQFAASLQIQLETLPGINVQQELLLRRLLEYPRQFCRPPASHLETSPQDPKEQLFKVVQLYASVLKKLIDICDEAHNVGDADQFCLELAGLSRIESLPDPLQPRERIFQAFDHASERLRTTWQELDPGPVRYRNSTCESVYATPFPSALLAIDSRLPHLSDHLGLELVESHKPYDCLGRQELHLAVEVSNVKLVRRLIDSSYKLKERDDFQISPILLAASVGQLDVFKALHLGGADLDDLDMFGRDALIVACEAGSDEIIEYLVPRYRDPNHFHPLRPYTALFAAAARGRSRAVRHLLAYNADCLSTTSGQKASQIAQQHGHAAVAALLRHAEEHAQSQFWAFVKGSEASNMSTQFIDHGPNYSDTSSLLQTQTTSSGPRPYICSAYWPQACQEISQDATCDVIPEGSCRPSNVTHSLLPRPHPEYRPSPSDQRLALPFDGTAGHDDLVPFDHPLDPEDLFRTCNVNPSGAGMNAQLLRENLALHSVMSQDISALWDPVSTMPPAGQDGTGNENFLP